MLDLVVDDRWRGEHGIARFAAEVVPRLPGMWTTLEGTASPTSPRDILNPQRLRLRADTVLYSPGFNAGFTRASQVLTIHDLIHLQVTSESSRAKSLFYNKIVRPAVRRAGHVITVSRTSANLISEWIDSPSVEVHVVGCGRSQDFGLEGDRRSFERPTFVYVGNLKPHKNVLVLLDAMVRRPEYGLLIVTADQAQARAEIAARGLGSRVSVATGLSDRELAAVYRGAVGAIQPSLLEGFGLPALEAMSCGTRVAFWEGCASVREICSGTGVSVDSATDPEGWASALDRLLDESSNGPLHVSDKWEAQYEWDRVGERVSAGLDRARK